VEQGQRQLGHAGGVAQQAGPEAGVDLRGAEAVRREDAVEGEEAAEPHVCSQHGTDAPGGIAHRLAVGGRRVPDRGRPGVAEVRPARRAEDHELDRPQRGDPVARDEAVDRARHPFEERRHPRRGAPGGEGGGGGLGVLGVPHPVDAHGAAVEAVPGVTGPHRAATGVETGSGVPEGADLDRHHR
jgi:hypothetical protein